MAREAAEPPKILIVTRDREWETRFRKALDAFPFAEPGTVPGSDPAQVCLVDARLAREFPSLIDGEADVLFVLANSVTLSPAPLPVEEKVALFEMGYSLVSEGADCLPSRSCVSRRVTASPTTR